MLDYAIRRTVDATSEPVTRAEMKRHANVVADDDDTLIDGLIKSARNQVENDIDGAIVSQTWQMTMHQWPTRCIHLPKPPLASVTSIQYVDTAGSTQTLSSAYYSVDINRQPGVVWWDRDYSLPSVDDEANVITVTYVAGYASASAVPSEIKQAVMMLAAHWYRIREVVGMAGYEVPYGYEAIIRNLKYGAYP